MGRSLSKEEIRAAMDKMRAKYFENAEKYDTALFNIERFNQRYMEALRMGLPEEQFLAGEVSIFQELVQKAEEKYAPKQKNGPMMADKMLEEFAARIAHYPAFSFSEKADEETKKLAGMLRTFERKWAGIVPAARSLPPGTKMVALAAELEHRIFFMLTPQSQGLSRAMDDMAIVFGRITTGEKERERMKKEFFKEAGFLLNLLADLFAEMKQVPDLYNDSFAEAATYVQQALVDFRLQEFKLRLR